MKNLLSVSVSGCVALAMVSGCAAGSVSGEIDGKTVPSFVDAAFGGVEDDNDAFAMTAFALPGDSCEDGGSILEQLAAVEAAGQGTDVDKFNGEMEDFADLSNDAIAVDDWYVQVGFAGADINDIRDEVYDIEDLDDDEIVSFNICLHEREHEVETVNGLAQFKSGDECFAVGEGELRFTLNDDDSVLRVTSEGEVEVQFDDGDKAGDVTLDVTFKGCPAIADGINARLENQG
jgi:hypothetical protein